MARGFIDGDASFSITQNSPRLRFENHVKELPLFNSIAEFFKSGNVNITKPRKNKINSNPTVTLDYTNIHFLKNVVVPLFSPWPAPASKNKMYFIFCGMRGQRLLNLMNLNY